MDTYNPTNQITIHGNINTAGVLANIDQINIGGDAFVAPRLYIQYAATASPRFSHFYAGLTRRALACIGLHNWLTTMSSAPFHALVTAHLIQLGFAKPRITVPHYTNVGGINVVSADAAICPSVPGDAA